MRTAWSPRRLHSTLDIVARTCKHTRGTYLQVTFSHFNIPLANPYWLLCTRQFARVVAQSTKWYHHKAPDYDVITRSPYTFAQWSARFEASFVTVIDGNWVFSIDITNRDRGQIPCTTSMAPFSLEFENQKGNLARKELNLKFRYVLASKNDVFAWHISHIAHGCLCYIMITHTFKWEGRSDGQCRKRCISLFNIALVKEWVAGVGRGYWQAATSIFCRGHLGASRGWSKSGWPGCLWQGRGVGASE